MEDTLARNLVLASGLKGGIVEVTKHVVQMTDIFQKWMLDLKDEESKDVILARIRRVARGLMGDVKPLGGGVAEIRIDYGPGYRVYYTKQGRTVILLLCGGTKRKQNADIARAKRLAKERNYET